MMRTVEKILNAAHKSGPHFHCVVDSSLCAAQNFGTLGFYLFLDELRVQVTHFINHKYAMSGWSICFHSFHSLGDGKVSNLRIRSFIMNLLHAIKGKKKNICPPSFAVILYHIREEATSFHYTLNRLVCMHGCPSRLHAHVVFSVLIGNYELIIEIDRVGNTFGWNNETVNYMIWLFVDIRILYMVMNIVFACLLIKFTYSYS